MSVNIAILLSLLAASLWTVLTRSLLRSAIGLALTSAILTILMIRLDSSLAAVFELSVCTGLISVLFISTISLTHPLTRKEILAHMRERRARFWFLPFLLIALGVILSLLKIKPPIDLPAPEAVKEARNVLWSLRQVDVMGQIIVLLTGVFGVVILFKERVKK
ncbi:MAG TPA: NADH-quinone oxidoreductase subunit J [Patescibacteria group bacterium]|nr:NADH-quinone oxidoreductase subunit J [Patescibacteria group bacterium]